jgi:hypothetical protein
VHDKQRKREGNRVAKGKEVEDMERKCRERERESASRTVRRTSRREGNARNVNMHRLVALPSGVSLDVPTSLTLDLHTGLRLLLDELDEETLLRQRKKGREGSGKGELVSDSFRCWIRSGPRTGRRKQEGHEERGSETYSGSDGLRLDVKVPNRLEVDEELLLRPFALQTEDKE